MPGLRRAAPIPLPVARRCDPGPALAVQALGDAGHREVAVAVSRAGGRLMGLLTNKQLDLAGNALRVLTADLGRTDADLAVILGVSMEDLRAVAGWLYGMRRLDRCREYLVLSPRRAGGRRTA
jgi:hypothetical protein